MKKFKAYKLYLASLFILILNFTTTTNVRAQVMGLWYYDTTDSIPACHNTPLDAMIGWYGGSGYVTGDNLNISVDWGDGNVDNLPTNTIYSNGSTAYIYSINPQHTYSTPGWYDIIISATDNYSNNFVKNDSVQVISNCGVIMGDVRLDDGDNVFETWEDVPACGVPIQVTTSISNYGGVSTTYGDYYINNIDHTATTYHVEIDPTWLSSNGFSVIYPVSGSYDFTTPPIGYNNYYFLLDCGGSYADASVSGYGWGFTANQSTGYIQLSLGSFSCAGTPGNVDLTVDFVGPLSVASSTISSYNVTGNSFTASINGISNFQFERIYFSVPAGTLPNTPLLFNVNINATNYTDANASNNQHTIHSMVLNAWDPNDKRTDLHEILYTNIDDKLQYNIRFQNEGNAAAQNITIVDTIDTDLDITSFRIVAQSHAMSYALNPTTRVVTFTFPNIMLPPQSIDDLGSQGFVRYEIEENTGLANGTELNNTAYIYFDSNPAIVTNTTSNINYLFGLEDENGENTISIYPQPASDIFYIGGINIDEIIKVSLLDGNGKTVQIVQGNSIANGISIGSIADGMYLVNVETKDNRFTQKLIVQH